MQARARPLAQKKGYVGPRSAQPKVPRLGPVI